MKHANPYRFMKDNQISAEDIEKIIELTKKNVLVWWSDPSDCGTLKTRLAEIDISDQNLCEQIIGENLRGVRITRNPKSEAWYQLYLKNAQGTELYISKNELALQKEKLANYLFEIAREAGDKK